MQPDLAEQTIRIDDQDEILKIVHDVINFADKGERAFEVVVDSFSFTEEGENDSVGGGATTVKGIISTRQANVGS